MKENIGNNNEFNSAYKLSEMTFEAIQSGKLDKAAYREALSNIDDADKFISDITNEEYVSNSVELIRGAYSKRNTEKLARRISEKARARGRFRTITTISASVAAAALFIIVQIINNDSNSTNSFIAQKSIDIADYAVPVITTDLGGAFAVDTLTGIEINSQLITKRQIAELNKEETSIMAMSKLIVPKGFTQRVTLADGSVVTLNAQSTLTYPREFSDSSRVVTLTGEGYFEVAKSSTPFIVKVKDLNVKVYGTSFNINEFNGNIETLLVSGSVGVTNNNESNEIILEPNQMLEYNKKMSESKVLNVNPQSYIGWLGGDFDYRSRPLSELLRDLSRWYDIEFATKENIDNIYVSFYSSRNTKPEEIFKLITRSNNLIFINNGEGKYDIKSK